MTENIDRLSENVPGPWFVSDECICCHLCGDSTPEIFEPTEDFCYHIVHHQPENNEEEKQAIQAAEECPVSAILKGD